MAVVFLMSIRRRISEPHPVSIWIGEIPQARTIAARLAGAEAVTPDERAHVEHGIESDLAAVEATDVDLEQQMEEHPGPEAEPSTDLEAHAVGRVDRSQIVGEVHEGDPPFQSHHLAVHVHLG